MGFILNNPTFIFTVTFCIIIVFSFVGVRESLGNMTAESYFNIDHTNWLKGIAIALVSYAHYYVEIETSFICSATIGAIGVGIFFLCSGYGLTISKTKKKDYHKYFLKNKLLRIYAPYTVAFVVQWLLVLFKPIECNDNMFLCYLTISLPNSIIWYLKVQVIMYIVYYILMLICKDNNKMLCCLMFVASIVYMIIGYCIGIPSVWYQNTLWFPIGIALAIYKTTIYGFIDKYFIRMIMSLLIMFALGFSLVYFIGGNVIYDMILIYGAIGCILIISTKVSGKSKLINFMGKHSIEIYFAHSIFLKLAACYFVMDNLIIAFSFLVATIFIAIPIKIISGKIVAGIDKITVK